MDTVLPLRELPPASTIDVWHIQLDRALRPDLNLDKILSVEERDRAGRYVFARDAIRFRHCRSMLRLGLAWYLRRTPQEVRLITNENGKPRLTELSALCFNVAHSEGLGLIAFTTVGEVGIDAESAQRDIEALDIASAHFTRNEAAIIASAETPQVQANTFLHFWTRKEAVLKAAGVGIVGGLDTFDVSEQHENFVKLGGVSVEIADSCWLVRDMELIDGFVGAIAAPAGDWSIRQWTICIEDIFGQVES